MRALTISANLQTGEDENLEGPALYVTIGISMLLGIGLFFLLPAGAAHFATGILGFDASSATGWTPWLSNLVEGLVRLVILIGYITLVGRVEDIKRVFGYHGAEHMTINAFEAGDELMPGERGPALPRTSTLRHRFPADFGAGLCPVVHATWPHALAVAIGQPDIADPGFGHAGLRIYPLDG